MEIDIAQLAAQTAAFLAPYLPYLVKGGKIAAKKAFEKAGEIFVEEGWEGAEALWKKLKPKVKAKPAAQDALEEFVKDPKEEDALPSLRQQIKKILAEDLKFAEEISVTIGKIDISHIQTGDQSVIVNAPVEHSSILTGKNNRVIQANTYIEGNVYKGPAPRNPQDALKVYRAVLANMTSSLSMRGIDLRASDPNTQKAIGLANVYIDLDTTTRFRERSREKEKVGLEPLLQIGWGNPGEDLSALDAVVENRKLVIKGDPGSGKSTFVNYIAHCLATRTTERLKRWNKQDTDSLPIIVILRDFIRIFKRLPPKAEPRHLWNFIEKRLKDQNLGSSSKPIQEILEKGKAIVFLDGLDEVSTVEQRIFVRNAVNAFVNRYPDNRYVVTCRILSYQPPQTETTPDLRLAGFPEVELAPFHDGKIHSFINAWYTELNNLGIVSVELANDLNKGLKRAVGRVELRRLASNPLLLTVMAVVNTHKGRLPDARALLYKETIEILLWQWEQASKEQETRLRQLLLDAGCADTDLEQIIWKLAYEANAQANGGEDDETLAGISELDLLKALAGINKGDLVWAARVIETMKLRAGLLLERENGVFTFPHRSFQEFLAGTFLESKDDFVARASELADNQLLWRQTILWAVSRRVYIRGSNDGPLALVAELCPSTESKDELGWSKVWLAGDILLEIGIPRVERSELGKDLLPRVQTRLVSLIEGNKLSPRERAEAGDTLAKLADPRPGVLNDFLFCEIPAGKFLMGNTKDTDPELYFDESPQFEYEIKHNYFISRYPVTNAQFDLFVDDPEGYKNGMWYTEVGWEWLKNAKQDRPPRQGGAFDLPNHPVVNVTWYEAAAFCKWLTSQLQKKDFGIQVYDLATRKSRVDEALKSAIGNRKYEIRLPSEAEWERAARGVKGQRYPWGDDFEQNHVNNNMIVGSTSAVACFPTGESPHGLLDMSGNVWEWCATQWTDDYQNYDKDENNSLEGDAPRMVRGGAFDNHEMFVRCAVRSKLYPHLRGHDNHGFRMVVFPFF